MNNSRLINMPGTKRSWNADGDTPVAATSTATPVPATKTDCKSCTNKKLACVAAGILIGIVGAIVINKG